MFHFMITIIQDIFKIKFNPCLIFLALFVHQAFKYCASCQQVISFFQRKFIIVFSMLRSNFVSTKIVLREIKRLLNGIGKTILLQL